MYSLETSLFALALIAVSALMVNWHWSAWQNVGREERDTTHKKFLYAQYRRRVQLSGLIGLIGVAMFIGQFLDRWPLVNAFHWSGVMLLALWVILLAMADLLVSRHYFGRMRRDQLLSALRYFAESERGTSPDGTPGDEPTRD